MTKTPLPPLSFHGLWSVCLQEEARVGTVGPTLSELAVVGLELAKRREREWSISRDWEWGQGGSGKAGGRGETEEEVWFENRMVSSAQVRWGLGPPGLDAEQVKA